MSDQAGLFDLPDPVPPRPPTRSGRGRARETVARTVVADVSVHDAGVLRAEALRALDHSVVIGEAADAEDDDLPDPQEEISTSPAAAVQWCVEPTMGMRPLLESGAVRIDMIDLSVKETFAGLVRVAWTVTVKILDAAAVRELALTACPATDVATHTEDVATHTEIEQSFATAWHWAADPHAPLAAIPGVTWTSVEVTVEQVLARAR
ncbi:MAG: hypothetical protein ACRDST_05070 [Pseudonocardiaceae bacterium]